MASKITDIALPAGHRLRLETPGGGGWGDPAARAAAATAHDLALGYVTR
jgi:N-methylhydantoinase B